MALNRKNVRVMIDEIIRSGRKSIAIEVKPGGRVIVRAPAGISLNRIDEIVSRRREWIIAKQKEIAEKAPPPRTYARDEEFWFMGKKYPLNIIKDEKYAFRFDGRGFIMSEECRPYGESCFALWYKEQARHILPGRTYGFARKYGFKPAKVKISSADTRWGSCSTRGNINYSWKLILLPVPLIDYVIIHELAHLIEHNHSRDFWAIVEKIYPDYKKARKWIKEKGGMYAP
ncbi:MAG: M48 family metallopeptidase [Candidatus Kapaibacterium sp.]